MRAKSRVEGTTSTFSSSFSGCLSKLVTIITLRMLVVICECFADPPKIGSENLKIIRM